MQLDIPTIYNSLNFLSDSIRLQYTNFIYRNQDWMERYLSWDEVLMRLRMDEPIEYVFNMAEFCGVRFYVDKRCLIPRPETQEIVNKAVELIRKQPNEKYTIIDVGTGSGCIILSIANQLIEFKTPKYPSNLVSKVLSSKSNYSFIGIDISPEALEVANINRNTLGHNFNVDLIEKPFQDFDFSKYENLIVCSNLPYIPNGEEVQNSVANFEPALALYGGDNGDELNKALLEKLKDQENVKAIFMEGYDGKIVEYFNK